jgi:hypothetical protein
VIRWSILALLLWPCLAGAQGQSLPPGERPVPVAAGFFLLNLSSVAERSETFEADLYLTFRWRDSRVAFAGSEPRMYLEDAAVDQLGRMWWPQVELVNTAEPDITNRALALHPDGTVQYTMGLSSSFRANLNLRRFPFDQQRLDVRVQSFLWTAEQMVFVSDREHIGFNPESTFEGLEVTQVGGEVRRSDLAGWGVAFSEFDAWIEVDRHWGFFLWTVFAPVTLIFLISCTVFLVHIENFQDRVAISLAALLACIATQFAMSFNLPQISYLTVIDKVFLVTYFCIAVGVAASTYEGAFLKHDHAKRMRVDQWAGLGLPLLFFVLIAVCVLW